METSIVHTEKELLDNISHFHAAASAAQKSLLTFIREYDSRELWRKDGCADMAQWLSGHLGISSWAGSRWTRAAHALEHLPITSRALEEGSLCLDKVLELSRFATKDDERDLVKWARRVTPKTIRKRAQLAEHPSIDEVKDIAADRFLSWWNYEEGSMFLEAKLPADEGAKVIAAVKRLAQTLPDAPDGESHISQRYADALVALCSHAISADADADRATVIVGVQLSALRGDGCGGEIEGSGVVHPEVVRRICCDSRLGFVIRDGDSALGIGYLSRTIPAWLRREMLHRDGGCTFPGCGRTAFTEGHHIWPWEIGGLTELDNLTTVCHFHHKLVHEYRWRVQLNGSVSEWFKPDGSRYSPGLSPPANTLGQKGLLLAV